MIYCNNTIYGKVWKVTPSENGKYIDLQMSTSEKKEDGTYVNSSWFPRVIGHAVNSLKGLKEGDRICITKSKFTNERFEGNDGKPRSYFKFLIFEAKIETGRTENTAEPVKEAPPAAALAEEDDCPW